MSSASRVWFCLVALSLSLGSPHLAQVQIQASTLSPSQATEEETLRKMTEAYGLAIEAGNLEAIRKFWNPPSANLAVRLRYYQNLFSEARIEFVSPKVTALEVTGSKAASRLTADERRLDKKTGAVLLTYDPLRGACRSFEWVKTDAGWKVERESLVQDDLAARLDAASEPERNELLEKEKVFVTNALILALSNRGLRHQGRGEYEAAMRCFRLQEAVAEKIGDQPGIAGALMNYGLMKYLEDEFEQSLQLTHKALALYETLGLKRGVAFALEKLSDRYSALSDHRRAFDYAQKSLRLYEELNYRRGMAEALSDLASIYGGQHNSEQALAHLERALAIAEELEDKILTAILRHNEASQHQRLGNYGPALEIYQGLLKQIEGSGDRSGAAVLRDSIGQVLAAQGKFVEAENYYRQAQAEFEATNEKGSIAGVLIDRSDNYLAQGKYAEALPLAERAVSLSREARRQRSLLSGLITLGHLQLWLNRPQEARQSLSESVAIIEKLRAQTAGGVGEGQRFFAAAIAAHHGLLTLLARENQAQEAFVFAERAKARTLLDILQQDGEASVQKAMTKEEQEQERRLKSELTRLNKQLGRATQSDKPDARIVGEIEARLEKARLNYEAFQNSLYAAHPELKIQRGEAPVITPRELTTLLPSADSALLEFVVTDDHTYLFVITKATATAEAETRVYTLAIKRQDLARQIEAFRAQLAARDLGFRPSASKLYNLLLKPAQAQLRGKTNFIIAADDKLWDLPFQALLTGTNRFLIEEAAIAYTPSFTVLREMTKRHKHQGADAASTTLLALGNPLLGRETVNRAALTMRDEKLAPLPEAEQEVKALRQLYGTSQSKVYIGTEAREDRVKREAGQARILHFAAHGMLNNASPMYSHLVLAEGGAGEDGLLEAWELMQMDLQADLAVLSACETARGRSRAGEGMIGLSWAMFIAGVPSIVVSQWKVESAGTRDLMVSFHRTLIAESGAGKAKLSKTEALRQAALKVMKQPQTRHPFYWAGFVLVGDGR